jgi:hypothetical protein
MQKKLLAVRCSLAGKDGAMHNIQLQGWINIMSVVQIYDDMQDIVIDDGFQDNLMLCAARRNFPGEWSWFSENKCRLNGKESAFLVSINMPCSVHFCLELAAEKIRTMNWEQQKIMHYLLKKNWFIASGYTTITGSSNELSGIYDHIKSRMAQLEDEAVKCYAVDVCFHKRNAKRQLLKNVNFTTAYQLRYNLLSMPRDIKLEVFEAVI